MLELSIMLWIYLLIQIGLLLKVDLGVWNWLIDVLTPSGSGNSEICIRIEEKSISDTSTSLSK